MKRRVGSRPVHLRPAPCEEQDEVIRSRNGIAGLRVGRDERTCLHPVFSGPDGRCTGRGREPCHCSPERRCSARFLRISGANIEPSRCHQARTGSRLISSPRSCNTSSTTPGDCGKLTWSIMARWMISSLDLKNLNGSCFVTRELCPTPCHAASRVALAPPSECFWHRFVPSWETRPHSFIGTSRILYTWTASAVGIHAWAHIHAERHSTS